MEIVIPMSYLIAITILMILILINVVLGVVKAILKIKLQKVQNEDVKYFKVPINVIMHDFTITKEDKDSSIIKLNIYDQWDELSYQLLSKTKKNGK